MDTSSMINIFTLESEASSAFEKVLAETNSQLFYSCSTGSWKSLCGNTANIESS